MKSNPFILILSLTFLFTAFFVPFAVRAQEVCSDPAGNTAIQQEICIQKDLNLKNKVIIVRVINFLLRLAGSLAVLFLIIGGVRYATAGDSKESTEQALRIIRAALTGLTLIIIALILIRTLQSAIICPDGERYDTSSGECV